MDEYFLRYFLYRLKEKKTLLPHSVSINYIKERKEKRAPIYLLMRRFTKIDFNFETKGVSLFNSVQRYFNEIQGAA